ncbi:MAG: aldo/keto reductase [Dehalococcoidia bacterium]
MEYRNLGRTGLKVSDFCLGCMTFGLGSDEEESRRIIDRALDAGVNFLDTANIYANGVSEEIVGRALKGRRDEIVLTSKFHYPMGDDDPNHRGSSRKNIFRSVEESLRRLQTDYIDLYQAHALDYSTPLEETLGALDDLVHQGKVRYIGCSNYSSWILTKALWVSDARRYVRFESIQPMYSLLARHIESELLPLCSDQGIGVIVYNPIAGGLLTGKYQFDQSPPQDTRFGHEALSEVYQDRYWHQGNFDAVERLSSIAREHELTLLELALNWVRANATVSSAIVGARTLEQLEQNLAAWGKDLPEEVFSACDEVWPSIKAIAPDYFRE